MLLHLSVSEKDCQVQSRPMALVESGDHLQLTVHLAQEDFVLEVFDVLGPALLANVASHIVHLNSVFELCVVLEAEFPILYYYVLKRNVQFVHFCY